VNCEEIKVGNEQTLGLGGTVAAAMCHVKPKLFGLCVPAIPFPHKITWRLGAKTVAIRMGRRSREYAALPAVFGFRSISGSQRLIVLAKGCATEMERKRRFDSKPQFRNRQ